MKKDGKETPSAASSDTVKGETLRPDDDPKADPTWTPTAKPAERETHNQPPALNHQDTSATPPVNADPLTHASTAA
jgi:hypothetical protein